MHTTAVLAVAFAASVAVPSVGMAGWNTEPPPAVSATEVSVLGFRHDHGLDLRRPLTAQSALAISLSSGPRQDQPDVRVMLGLRYSF